MSDINKRIPSHLKFLESVFENTSFSFTSVRVFTDGDKLYFFDIMNNEIDMLTLSKSGRFPDFPNLIKRLYDIQKRFNRNKILNTLLDI